MKAQELRIGNWINLNGNDVISVMGDIQEICYEEVSPKYINEYKPIPLTEEWLVKFGFVFKKDQFVKGKIKLNYTIRILSTNERGAFREVKNGIAVIHVHQLQNLFFALTAEELTTNNQD